MRNQSNTLYFIGAMGAGKTTIGRCVASRLHLPFKDSDHEIETLTGASIPLIFELEGEAGFRKREQEMIEALTQEQPLVLATGGGAVLAEGNRQYLRERGFVIYLRASLNQLLERTRHRKNRPLLQTDNPREKLQQILTAREPLYLATADWVLDTEHQPVKNLLQTIIQHLEALDDGWL